MGRIFLVPIPISIPEVGPAFPGSSCRVTLTIYLDCTADGGAR